MLEIEIPARELFNDETSEFIYVNACTLRLEHSLVSLSKWESKWCKPFLTKESKTHEELIDYIKCMTLTQNVDPNVYNILGTANMNKINKYIENPMTATTFGPDKSKPNREVVTSELIYYWMIALNIPFECQKWHLNRLLTLIKVCSIKNQPPKKMSKNEILSRNAALNAARRKQLGTSG